MRPVSWAGSGGLAPSWRAGTIGCGSFGDTATVPITVIIGSVAPARAMDDCRGNRPGSGPVRAAGSGPLQPVLSTQGSPRREPGCQEGASAQVRGLILRVGHRPRLRCWQRRLCYPVQLSGSSSSFRKVIIPVTPSTRSSNWRMTSLPMRAFHGMLLVRRGAPPTGERTVILS